MLATKIDENFFPVIIFTYILNPFLSKYCMIKKTIELKIYALHTVNYDKASLEIMIVSEWSLILVLCTHKHAQ